MKVVYYLEEIDEEQIIVVDFIQKMGEFLEEMGVDFYSVVYMKSKM